MIGGRDRWARRLEGLRREFELKLADLEEAGDAATDRVRRELSDLESLRRFAWLSNRAACPWALPSDHRQMRSDELREDHPSN